VKESFFPAQKRNLYFDSCLAGQGVICSRGLAASPTANHVEACLSLAHWATDARMPEAEINPTMSGIFWVCPARLVLLL
jgi:hypothetical protein